MADIATQVNIFHKVHTREGDNQESVETLIHLGKVVLPPGTNVLIVSQSRRVSVQGVQNGAPMNLGGENRLLWVIPKPDKGSDVRTNVPTRFNIIPDQGLHIRVNVPATQSNGLHTVEGKSSYSLVKPPTPDDL